jgi:hypothetical protein
MCLRLKFTNEDGEDSMIINSIKDKNIFRIEEEANKRIFYGSNQEWFMKRWQRLSGCGPSAVANIIYYLNRTRNNITVGSALTRQECLHLMNEIWNYVTPGFGGISSTCMLCNGVRKYLLEKKLSIKLDFLDIPKKNALRPDLHKVILFLSEALKKDSPVAFLNLNHGAIYELESWHWVTIISLEYELDDNMAFVSILDGGIIKRIDLSNWLRTTTLGGGFVSFET